MGHQINAFLSYKDVIHSLANDWLQKPIDLNQNLAMLFLTDDFYDEIVKSTNIKDKEITYNFLNLAPSIFSLMEKYSKNTKLTYFETDYFGGIGSQSAIFYENSKLKFSPLYTNDMKTWDSNNQRAINFILRELGVYCENKKDEFDSINLGNFRSMYKD